MTTYASIAFRNLSRQKKRSFLLGAAIAFGIMIVTLINGFAGSMSPNLSKNFAHLLAGHIFIEGTEKYKAAGDSAKPGESRDIGVIRDDAALTAALALAGDKIQYVTRRSDFYGTFIFEGKKVRNQVTGAYLFKENYLKDRLVLVEGSWETTLSEPRALVISDVISKKLNVQIGDRILVQMETINEQSNVGEFVLTGITRDTGMFGQMQSYAQLPYVNELIGLKPTEYQTMGLLLREFRDTEPTAALIYAELGKSVQVFEREKKKISLGNSAIANAAPKPKQIWEGVKYKLSTINEEMSDVEEVVSALDIISAVILIILFVIIMVGILNTFRMVMYERIREIGTMRAIGIPQKGVRQMFLFEALFLAIGGAVAGIIVALLIMLGLSFINFGTNTPFFILLKNGHLSFFLPPLRAVFNIVLIALLTLLAALVPAIKASKLSPAVALRTQK